jgi:hypothetical protein
VCHRKEQADRPNLIATRYRGSTGRVDGGLTLSRCKNCQCSSRRSLHAWFCRLAPPLLALPGQHACDLSTTLPLPVHWTEGVQHDLIVRAYEYLHVWKGTGSLLRVEPAEGPIHNICPHALNRTVEPVCVFGLELTVSDPASAYVPPTPPYAASNPRVGFRAVPGAKPFLTGINTGPRLPERGLVSKALARRLEHSKERQGYDADLAMMHGLMKKGSGGFNR